MSKVSRIYWDSCIFITLLNPESEIARGVWTEAEVSGIRHMIRQLEADKLVIAASLISHSEVLAAKLKDSTIDDFNQLMRGPTIRWLGIDLKVSKIAHEIRNFYVEHPIDRQFTLSNSDAIHLATAIRNNYEVFYTFDNNQKSGKPMGLIQISGNIAGKYRMIIKKPEPVAYHTGLESAGLSTPAPD